MAGAVVLRAWAVRERADRARADGRRYLLVCYDVWDRRRGDEDLGYYYPSFDGAHEVAAFLADKQLAVDTTGYADVCEAVIDLERATGDFDVAWCEAPADWLARSGFA